MEPNDPILPPTTDSTTISGESSEPRGPVPALSPPDGGRSPTRPSSAAVGEENPEAVGRRTPNPYEAKQEARRQRLLAASARAATEAEQLHNRAERMGSVIPFGQPILVGHHSEGRDRRFRAWIHETYRKSFEAQTQAEQLRQRAASVGTAGVSSDDPEAIAKLRTKLASLERLQSRMTAGNTIVRDRKLTDAEKIAELVKLGLKEANAAKALTPDFVGRVGFPDYALKNNNAEIRRVRARIEALESAQRAPGREPVQGDGWVIEEDRDENRVAIRFEGIPATEVRARLKAHGFRWSLTRRAWVRMLSNAAWYAATSAMKSL